MRSVFYFVASPKYSSRRENDEDIAEFLANRLEDEHSIMDDADDYDVDDREEENDIRSRNKRDKMHLRLEQVFYKKNLKKECLSIYLFVPFLWIFQVQDLKRTRWCKLKHGLKVVT